MLKGWISCDHTEKKFLESIGIKLGVYINGCFEDCEVSDEAFEKLDPLWGQIFWGLQ
jgi:hypothetical protein